MLDEWNTIKILLPFFVIAQSYSAFFLHHEGHEDHEEISSALRALRALRGK
jgi:hypothetical protein